MNISSLDKKRPFPCFGDKELLSAPTDSALGHYLAQLWCLSECCMCVWGQYLRKHWNSWEEELQGLKKWKTCFIPETQKWDLPGFLFAKLVGKLGRHVRSHRWIRYFYKKKLSQLSDKGKTRFTCMVFTKDSFNTVVDAWEHAITREGLFVSFRNFCDSKFYSCQETMECFRRK